MTAPSPVMLTPSPASSIFPDVEKLVTEDDTPVDNIASAKQQRLLVETLYSSWGRPAGSGLFLADANVGLFFARHEPPLVPDVFLRLDVQPPEEWWSKEHCSYFFWEYGGPPDLVVEIVSNTEGGEDTRKLRDYARIKVQYYVIYDPSHQLGEETLRAFELRGRAYAPIDPDWLPDIELGLTLWQGTFEGSSAEWLRWRDRSGQVIPTGAERAERLAARLRALGVDPDSQG